VPPFEKVQPGNEQILEDREQRKLDGPPTALDPAGIDGGWVRGLL
jgi:hypothetical protein